MRLRTVTCVTCAALALAGCASSAQDVGPQYVSPLQFGSLDCGQLAQEAQRVTSRVAHLSGVQDQKATNDAIVTGVAVVVFLPIALFVSGNDQNTAELARLKGEIETIEKVSIQKKCNIQFQRAPPPRPVSPPKHEPGA